MSLWPNKMWAVRGGISDTNCTPGSSSSFCGQEQAGSSSLRCWEELCGSILCGSLLCTSLLVEILFCFCIIPITHPEVHCWDAWVLILLCCIPVLSQALGSAPSFPRVFTLLLHSAETPWASLSPQLCHGKFWGLRQNIALFCVYFLVPWALQFLQVAVWVLGEL